MLGRRTRRGGEYVCAAAQSAREPTGRIGPFARKAGHRGHRARLRSLVRLAGPALVGEIDGDVNGVLRCGCGLRSPAPNCARASSKTRADLIASPQPATPNPAAVRRVPATDAPGLRSAACFLRASSGWRAPGIPPRGHGILPPSGPRAHAPSDCGVRGNSLSWGPPPLHLGWEANAIVTFAL